MEFTWKTANGNFKDVSVELDSEVMELSGNTENYCEVYKELAELVGESGAMKILRIQIVIQTTQYQIPMTNQI